MAGQSSSVILRALGITFILGSDLICVCVCLWLWFFPAQSPIE